MVWLVRLIEKVVATLYLFTVGNQTNSEPQFGLFADGKGLIADGKGLITDGKGLITAGKGVNADEKIARVRTSFNVLVQYISLGFVTSKIGKSKIE